MDFALLLDFVIHIDKYLVIFSSTLGSWTYLLLFLIIFCETGLVVFPFLPGDSLLFTVGAMTTLEGSGLNFWILFFSLTVAGILGDATNYYIGSFVGRKAFTEDSRFLKKKHLIKTHDFYERHGPITIVIARFIPIVRTFAPFVAGIGEMSYAKFATYNVFGSIVWVLSFLVLGHFFGNLPIVKENFQLVILAIVIISYVPILVAWIRSKMNSKRG